jgi:hypothetical protein
MKSYRLELRTRLCGAGGVDGGAARGRPLKSRWRIPGTAPGVEISVPVGTRRGDASGGDVGWSVREGHTTIGKCRPKGPYLLLVSRLSSPVAVGDGIRILTRGPLLIADPPFLRGEQATAASIQPSMLAAEINRGCNVNQASASSGSTSTSMNPSHHYIDMAVRPSLAPRSLTPLLDLPIDALETSRRNQNAFFLDSRRAGICRARRNPR